MKKSWHKVNDRKMYLEQFDSYIEFYNNLMKRDTGEFERRCKNSGFSGLGSVEEARDLFLNGWDKPVESIKKQISKEIDNLLSERKKMSMFNDVAGYIPNVPNAIMGLPQSMINCKKDIKKQRVIKFLIDSTLPWYVKTNEITKFYSKVVANIAMLEKLGYRCRIEMFEQYANPDSSKTIVAKTVKIKDEMQPFDIKRMSFAISHAGFFRVFGFAWENAVKDSVDYDDYHEGGLGKALEYWEEDERKKVIENVRNMNEKCVYISYECNLNKIFGRKGGEAIG